MLRYLIKLLLFITIIIVCPSLECQNLYTVIRSNNKIEIKFNECWYFTKIAIPVCSAIIWGDDKSHNVAVIEFENEKHIISSKPGEKYLEYNDSTKAVSSIFLTSINLSSENITECLPLFKAASSKTQEIEDSLLMISQRENEFLLQNRCFSCHRLIPAALVFRTAYKKGFNIREKEINKLTEKFSALQKDNGSFYFEREPVYGVNTTTVTAAFIASLFSDISNIDFLKIGLKAKNYLNSTHKDNEIIPPDFIFEPFFNYETTSILFEIIFQKNLYLKDSQHQKDSNDRANNLLKHISFVNDKGFNNKLILLCGIPYSYRLSPDEIPIITAELNKYLAQPQSKISIISKILSLFVLKKISPKEPLHPIFLIKGKNVNKDYEIWNCLKEIIYNTPKYLNGNYDDK